MANEPLYPELRDADWLRARYVDEGLSQDQIAELLGFECARATVGQWLRRHGIPARPISAGAPHGRPRWTEGRDLPVGVRNYREGA